MQTTEQALFKSIPEQLKPESSDFSLQKNAVEQWFDTLPLANIRVSTKSIYKALKTANQQKASYKKRLYFLEKIHEPVIELASNLKKLNLNRTLPLDEKHNRIALLIQKLHQQIIIGYKCVLRDLNACSMLFFCFGKKTTKALVISRIIRHHSLSLIANYQLYNTPQKEQWSEVNQLFLLAHNEKLLNKGIYDPSQILHKNITIKSLYLQILLVALADPYRMAQHHIYALFKQLEEWSTLADINITNSIDRNTKDTLAIDLSQTGRPIFVAPQDIPNNHISALLNTSRLNYARLIEHFQGPETQTTEINAELLKQLSISWGVTQSRQHNRRPAQSRLKVAIGLNNVHYVLNGFSTPDWMNASDSEEQTLELSEHSYTNNTFSSQPVESTVKVSDIWGEVFKNKLLSKSKTTDDSQHSSTEDDSDSDILEWKMLDESIGGYCLLWEHGETINAKVGEVIAISHEAQQTTGYWFVGTIRWMKCLDDNSIQIGIQIIAPNAIAVSTAKFVSMREGMKSRAIILPAIPVLKQPKTLVTTALGYETNDQVILDEYRMVNSNLTSVRTKVVLRETLEFSSHFARFKYVLAEDFYNSKTKKITSEEAQSKDSRNPKDTISLDSDTDFDSIWDDL